MLKGKMQDYLSCGFLKMLVFHSGKKWNKFQSMCASNKLVFVLFINSTHTSNF